MSDFFDMGGYALWVWSAYGVTTIALLALVIETRRSAQRARKQVEALKDARRGGQQSPQGAGSKEAHHEGS